MFTFSMFLLFVGIIGMISAVEWSFGRSWKRKLSCFVLFSISMVFVVLGSYAVLQEELVVLSGNLNRMGY